MSEIVVVLDNLRSIHNVGSIMRTCDGLGVKKIFTVGTTPHMKQKNDDRMPHILNRFNNQINKTALGAQENIENIHFLEIEDAINRLKENNYEIVAIEQSTKSRPISSFKSNSNKLALLFGPEVHGLSKDVLFIVDDVVEIPMKGKKESLNVSVAVAIAIYHFSMN